MKNALFAILIITTVGCDVESKKEFSKGDDIRTIISEFDGQLKKDLRDDIRTLISEFGKQLKQDVEDDSINGSISMAIVKGNEIIWSEAYGTSDINNGMIADTSTIYRTGSISKSFTAFLMMQLVQEGIIDLKEPIEAYLPEIINLDGYTDSTKITFQQLASHTSGLSRDPVLVSAASGPIEEWENKILLSIPKTPFHSAPGERFYYSNIGYGILGLALSRAADKSFIDLVKDKIFIPLSMNNSFFIVPYDKLSNLSKGMERGTSRYLDMQTPEKEHAGRGYGVPNGGIYSTPNDLAKFMIANMGYTESLNSYNLELMQSTKIPEREKWGNYGFGLLLYQDSSISTVGHGGMVSGYTADFLFEKECQYGVILMRNYNWGMTKLNSRSVTLLRKLKELDAKEGKQKEHKQKLTASFIKSEKIIEQCNVTSLTIDHIGVARRPYYGITLA
ncbi:MAG: beta-lactamase family protein [Flavobacteriales bacterium]|nr:beta-lactamase family protein [Flavobacteriales bacterium]